MSRVLVTGATGFVGQTLCAALGGAGYAVRAALRRAGTLPGNIAESAIVGEIDTATDWHAALEGVDVIVHAAARAHRLGDDVHPEVYTQTNALGTRRLAQAAAAAGVRRLVYLSTAKVNGEGSGTPYTAQDPAHPAGAYATSKWLGEQHLLELAAATRLEAAIVRPPLVYGPAVRANFLRLLRWVDRGWPLPLGSVHNRRSLVNVWNLCDLVLRLLVHPAAPGRVWMVSDGDDRSTPDLLRTIGRAMQRPVRLIAAPVAVLRAVGTLSGRSADVSRLCDSLQVNITPTCHELQWAPPVAVDEGVARTVRWYLSSDPRASSAR
jgi:nucleoside-diphosphate-sugar epimerase